MKIQNQLFILMTVLLFCSFAQADIMFGKVSKTINSIKLPQEVVEVLQNQHVKAFRESNQDEFLKDLSDEQIKARIKRKGLSVRVKLTPEDSGVLNGKYLFNLPQGGGEIVLSEYVNSKYPGRFKVWFDIDIKHLKSINQSLLKKNLNVYYVSQAKSRTVNGKKVGAGCFKHFDITTKYFSEFKHEGLLVDASKLMHTSALAGIFVFSISLNNELYLNFIQFSDHKHKLITCA